MKYYIALFQKIKEYNKAQSSSYNEVALICPLLTVYEESEMELMLPQALIDDKLKYEALLKKQDISFQLNSLPSSDKYWKINPSNTLFQAYDQIINVKQEIKIQAEDLEDDQAKNTIYDTNNKPTKEKKAYDKYFALLEKIIVEWQDHVSKYSQLITDSEKQIWLEKLNLILLKKEKAIVDHKLLGNKKIIENALNTINKTDEFDNFLANLQSSRNVFEMSKKTGIQSLESYLDINFVPYDFMSNNNGWTKLTIEKKELEELYEAAKIQKDDFPEEIISIEYNEKDIIGIELEFSIVTMQRNWFSLTSIVSDFFKWTEAKSISDGETISNEFILSAYPKKMILIKNLKININQAIDSGSVSNINQLIQFGPIIMKNQLFINSNSNIKFIKAIRNKETLSSNNISYYSNKVLVNRTAISTPPIPTAQPILQPSIRPIVMHGTTIRNPTVIMNPVLLTNTVFVNPVLFQPVTVIVASVLAILDINIKDVISKLPVYKSEISVMGINNTVFKEIESDNDGKIKIELPVGNYTIEIRKDGYGVLKTTLNVDNLNTISKDYFLDPKSVTYNSFFLLGMICEKLPKVPK